MSDESLIFSQEIHRLRRCPNDDHLHVWVRTFCGLNVPRNAVCPHHDAPFDYLRRSYFEPASDQLVWAPRGGGKTRLAAVATLLDLLHKPGCSVRILGGSIDQSLRMWEHLMPDLVRVAKELIDTRSSSRRVALSNGSSAAALPQSQRAVRGLRVQKLRCDEVEMFDPQIWEAAQLVTKSRDRAAGAVEALSTLHKPFGLMSRIVEHSKARVLKWCLLEVLEKCPQERDCATCPLWDECRGVAKQRCDGFMKIDDAIAMKRRVGREMWETEMLCRKPSVRGCVFPTFAVAEHVCDLARDDASDLSLAIDFGFAAPFVCLWVRTFADGTAYVIDEYVQEQQTVEVHLQQIQSRTHSPATKKIYCDPAGAGRNDQTAASNVAVLRSAGYVVRYRQSRIVDGLEMIRAALRPALLTDPPRLFIHPRCLRLIRAMSCYHYPEGGSEVPAKDGEHDHLIDALRYYFVNRGGRDLGVHRY